MRFIRKGSEPRVLTRWKAKSNEGFSKFRGRHKTELKNLLIKEQHGLCCYCEGALQMESSQSANLSGPNNESGSHIEHFKPQTKYPELSLEYSNLHCSCIGNPSYGAPLHCGHAKGESFSERLISPLDPVCENRFRFLLDGTISPRIINDRDASETIDVLKLDIPK